MRGNYMKILLIGINSKYIHPSVSLYQLKKNTTYECDILELTIKDSLNNCINKIYQYDLKDLLKLLREILKKWGKL